jgi:hypothetical protein
MTDLVPVYIATRFPERMENRADTITIKDDIRFFANASVEMIAVEPWSSAKTFSRENPIKIRAPKSLTEINRLKWNTIAEECRLRGVGVETMPLGGIVNHLLADCGLRARHLLFW